MDLSWAESPKPAPASEDVTVQGSQAWLKWRGRGIGSSDAAVLLGLSPWKNLTQLYEEKLGLYKPVFGYHQRAAMERGKELEPKIRQWYEARAAAPFPDAISEIKDAPHLRASFDGLNLEFKNPEDGSLGRMIEIKAPNKGDHEGAKAGVVPEKYVPQVQWLMLVGAVPWADYVSYGSDGTYAVVTLPADPVMQAELRRRADLFWQHVQTKVAPPEWDRYARPLSSPVIFPPEQALNREVSPTPEEQDVEALVANALLAQEEAKLAVERYTLLQEKLRKVAGDSPETVCGEARFGWIKRKGAVDYSVIPELIGIDLDQFRKPDTRAFYFERKKK